MKIGLRIFIIIVQLWQYAVQTNIVFPSDDEFPTDCKLPDGSKGTCRNLLYCPAAIKAKKVNTCYFEGNDEYVCCKENMKDDIETRAFVLSCGESEPDIIRGFETEYKEFPYMVALGWKSLVDPKEYEYKCGGVLIGSRYVLTAAHCARLNGLSPVVALVGGTNLTAAENRPIRISEVKIHPGYKENKSYHDIAVIRLEQDAKEKPICVWGSYSVDGSNVTAIGYGHTRFAGAGSISLLKAYLLVISNQDCSKYYSAEPALPHGVVETQICAKDSESIRDTCQGDSGGPLILYSENGHGISSAFVVGITSFGRALPHGVVETQICAKDSESIRDTCQGDSGGSLILYSENGHGISSAFVVGITSFGRCYSNTLVYTPGALEPPGVYTRVSEYIDWIEEIAFKEYISNINLDFEF